MSINNSAQDPWTWGYEDNAEESHHNEWNPVWNSSNAAPNDFKKVKVSSQIKPPSNQESDYYDSINLSNTSQQMPHSWQQGGDFVQSNFTQPQTYLPQPNPANYFNNNINNNNNNNNAQSDVENKEVAPPDNHYIRNSLQTSMMKDSKHGRAGPEQLTTQLNKKVPPPSISGPPPMGGPLFGSKPNHQNNVHSVGNGTNSMFNSLPNSSRNLMDQQHNNAFLPGQPSHAAQSSIFSPSTSHFTDAVIKPQLPLSSLADISQNDSSKLHSGPQSLPIFRTLQNPSGSTNSEERHSSNSVISVTPTNTAETMTKDTYIISPSLFPPSESTTQAVYHQAHQVSDPSTHERLSHTLPQNEFNEEQMIRKFDSAVSQSDINSHHPPLTTIKQEIKTNNETSAYPNNLTTFPNQHPVSEQPQHNPVSQQFQTPALSQTFQPPPPLQQSQPPLMPQQPTLPPIPQPPSIPLLPHQSSLPPISQQLPMPPTSQQPTSILSISQQLPMHSLSQQPPLLPMLDQPPNIPISQQHSLTSVPQQANLQLNQQAYPFPVTHQSQAPEMSLQHQFSNSQPSHPPPVSQQLNYPPQNPQHSYVPQISQPSHLQINQQSNSLSTSQQSHISQPSFQTLAQQPPKIAQQPQDPQHSLISHQPPTINQPVPSQFSASQQPDSHQSNQSTFRNMSGSIEGSQNVSRTLSSYISQEYNIQQEQLIPDSQAVHPLGLNDFQNKEIYSSPLENCQINQNAPSSDFGSQEKENDVINQARYTPSPQHPPQSQTPPNTRSSLNARPPLNVDSTFPTNNNGNEKNSTFDKDAPSYSTPSNKSQMSFNFQNVHPVASSSPVVTQSIPENQERLIENHEMPDNTENLHLELKNLSINREVENEAQVHCQVDRNQYLETGHLSGSKDHILMDNSPNVEAIDESEAPPPGLHRLVTGQGCESRGPMTVGDHPMLLIGAESSAVPDDNRHSSPSSSTAGSVSESRNTQSAPVGESEVHPRTGRLVQGQSIGDDTDGVREVPGEATPFHNRIVLGQMGRGTTPPLQDNNTTRGENSREREIVGRMVLGERLDRDHAQTVGSQDDFRQGHRSLRRTRRGESSYEDEDHDYPSDRDRDRDRRVDEFKRRGDDRVRHRTRRDHRSPEYNRSDEEFEDRRGFARIGRSERRTRDYSPEMAYYSNYRDDHRRHRRYDHYRDYEDDYYYRENRSRPSSRTGSDYRRVNLDYACSRNRSMYYPDLGAIPYNPRAPEEYYETMRRLDPVGYAAWYNQYMSSRFNVQQTQASYNNDRASVHSGQSSNNNRQNVSTPQAEVEEIGREEESFVNATAYVKAKFDSYGRLLVIDPHYPTDNQKPTVNLYKITKLPTDEDTEEFLESPGPFVPGVTHRNTVLQYLKSISDKSTKSSEKLLYDLVHLSVKSNGELNFLDVADLLMDSYKKSQVEEGFNISEPLVEQISTTETMKKFRELLQQGNKMEALDWAIEQNAWGHALFLASKMDERTHNNIMLRFANSIPHNDPLQTLYQLMSGHIPQASSYCADKKWSDWRPHLAMILGNPTGNPKLDKKAITKLGDSLYSRGRIFAAHFCYITAQVDFSTYKPDAKLVLLGTNANQEFIKFVTCRAIMVTMCYEYGLKLKQPNANIPTLQLYKLILATRLIDHGKSRMALQYCELIANEAVRKDCCERNLIACVIDLSSKLKMLDPTLALTGDLEKDPDWLAALKNFSENLTEDYDANLAMNHCVSSSSVSEVGQEIPPQQEKNINNDDIVNTYNSEPTINTNKSEFLVPSVQPIQQPLTIQTSMPPEVVHQEDPQQTYQPSLLPPLSSNTYCGEQYPQQNNSYPQQNAVEPYWNSSNNITAANNYPSQETPIEAAATVSSSKNNFFKASEEQLKLNDINKESNKSNVKPSDNKTNKSEDSQHSGWFGGILEKFSIRPKNQMRLPDDSNPSIVWDAQKNKWVNLEDEGGEGNASAKAPPRMAEPVKPQPFNNDNSLISQGPPNGNKYKIPKGRTMKSNYVNIMGTANKTQPNAVRPMDVFPPAIQSNNSSLFVPSPADGNNYAAAPVDYSNSGVVANNSNKPVEGIIDNKQLSRCSSVSSLSREVQYYMAPRNSHTRPPVRFPARHNSSNNV